MATPLCPYFGSCGGCSAQHIEYELQIENKKKQLQQITNFSDIQVFSDKEYAYRNRMDFIFQKNGLGFRKKEHWDKVVEIKNCVIAEKRIQELMQEINNNFTNIDFFDLQKHTGTFRYAVIRKGTTEASISFVLNSDSSRIAEGIEKIKTFAEKSTAENILITYVPANTDQSTSSDFFIVKGKDHLTAKYIGKKFQYPIQGFFQNNHSMAEKMQEYVHKMISTYNTENAQLIDLYGGVGAFGIINASNFKKTRIVESFPQSIEAAKENIILNKEKNTEAILLDAKNIHKMEIKQPLFLITDPPRTGMEEKTMQTIKIWKPERIIYISCNPQQLAKDIPKLRGYKIQSAALFDLFPQTSHSEAVLELRKEDSPKNI